MELIPSFEGRHYKKPREPEEPRAGNREKEEKEVSSGEFVVCSIFGVWSYGGHLLRLGGLVK